MKKYELFDVAKKYISELPEGTVFFVATLLADEFENLDSGMHSTFGKFFKEQLDKGHLPNVEYLGRTSANKYKKI